MTSSLSGISPQTAALYATLMEAQSQASVITALTGAPSDGTNSGAASQGDTFASLLSSAMNLSGSSAFTSGLSSTGLAGLNGLNGLSSLGGIDPTTLLGSASPSSLASLYGLTMPATGTSSTGQSIAATATSLAQDLTGVNNNAYNPATTPLGVQQTWNAPGWGNGNVQCVAFVDGAYKAAGITLPATPNATDFMSAYANQPGFTEVANGQGLPQPGDIIVMGGGPQGYGHVAIVTNVIPPQNGQPGAISVAQSNSPSSTANLTLNTDGSVNSWPGYPVQGFIRSTS